MSDEELRDLERRYFAMRARMGLKRLIEEPEFNVLYALHRLRKDIQLAQARVKAGHWWAGFGSDELSKFQTLVTSIGVYFDQVLSSTQNSR